MQSNDLFVLEAIENLQYKQPTSISTAKGDLIHGNVYGEILDELVKGYLSNMELRGLTYIWGKYDKALTEARRNNLEQAQQLLSEAEAVHAENELDSGLYALADVSALPMKAYLHYKKNEFEQAESLLYQSLKNDILLIKEGFYILEYHRIQQLHNINRSYFRKGQLLEGAAVIRQALAYILYEHIPTIGTDWSVDSIQKTPDSLRSAMFLQLALEPIGVFLHHISQEKELFQAAFANLTFFEPRSTEEEIMLQWFELKELYFKGNNNHKFITETLTFLSNISTDFDILKLSLVANLTDALKDISTYNASYHEKIIAFGTQLKVSDRHKQACFTYVNQVSSFEI
jgi:hypothetical protein